ncbi:aldo/keto reductase [Novipirellula artificiosorum]|uniref:General stress protein 69 n=1 Tax=Novipirellula artificiosorum TaxID=2528016 RepID=A0A5C6E0U7_9BACT|nr:aldo/keto reductase [Novipirellula artificiosorum]TWU40966.1 General stress protein 69 [Novipirellula artificiosorum]
MKRRSFLKTVSGTVGAGALVAAGIDREAAAEKPLIAPAATPSVVKGMPQRVLGKTGLNVSTVTFPGLALVREEQDACNEAIHSSFERGINYFDVAPAYGNGDCEIKMGIGLQGLERDDYVLSCKTKMRDKAGARLELDRSLERLKTDYFDLYQFHCFIDPEEVAEVLAPGGAMETVLEAQKAGQIKHIGFSAHTTKSALRALRHFDFDTAMFAINFVEYYTIGFGKPVLELAQEKGTAVIGMKTLGNGRWPKGVEKTRKWWYRTVETDEQVRMALQFTLSLQPVATAIPPSWLDLVDKAIDQAKGLTPATDEDFAKAQKLSEGCESVFHQVEQSVAQNTGQREFYADSPHEGPPCMFS